MCYASWVKNITDTTEILIFYKHCLHVTKKKTDGYQYLIRNSHCQQVSLKFSESGIYVIGTTFVCSPAAHASVFTLPVASRLCVILWTLPELIGLCRSLAVLSPLTTGAHEGASPGYWLRWDKKFGDGFSCSLVSFKPIIRFPDPHMRDRWAGFSDVWVK